MSGKLSIYDAFVTVGAFILALGLYQHVKPLLSARAYAANDEDEQPIPIVNASRYDPPTNYTNNPSRPRPIAYKDCVRGGGHPKCCDAALHGGITQDEFDNCHLCNHPDCSGSQFDT